MFFLSSGRTRYWSPWIKRTVLLSPMTLESEDSGVPATDQDKVLAEKEKVRLHTHSIVLRLSHSKPDTYRNMISHVNVVILKYDLFL